MLKLFFDCDRGMAGFVYPDGGSVLDQPVLLLRAFAVIASAKSKAGKRDQG